MATVTIPDSASVEAAGAVMDSDFAGSQTGSLVRTGAGTYTVIRDNDAATTAPGSSNDDTEGYSRGSRWTDTVADEVYYCASASTGNAVWRQIGSGGGGGGSVSSVFGRTGAVGAATGDYDASQVDFAPAGDLSATDVQAAIVELRDDGDTKLAAKADTSALSAHAGATANPHATDLANLGGGTLAELNALVSDATLDDSSSARTPTAHAASHAGGGGDAIPDAVASGASGLLSGPDKAKLDGITAGAEPNAVDSVHGRTGAVTAVAGDYAASEVSFAPDGDIAATTAQTAIVEVRDDADIKLAAKADTSALSAHTGDSANPHGTDLGNLGTGTLAQLNGVVSDATLDDASSSRPPTSHASSHERGGGDEIDGDHLAIDYTPGNYTPTTSPSEADDVDDLAAHLAGIDAALGGGGAGGDVVGPGSSTDNAVARFDSTTGVLLQDSAVTVDDAGNVAGVGNLSLSGTVDGRDVGADGAKLDGVEPGADVTDAANVAAAGALMTTGGALTGAVTTSSTIDGRDVSADGATLDAHVGAANPHSGSLSTSHEGAGGAVHAVAVASGAAGFLSGSDKAKLDGIEAGAEVNDVDSVFGRTGTVTAQTGDYTAAQVTGAVQVGGQLGGAAATPDVRGLRTTEGGGTLLTLGDIANGEFFVRNGSVLEGGTPAGGGGGGPSIDGVEGVTNVDHWSEAAPDPLAAAGSFTASVMGMPLTSGPSFARRMMFGTRNAPVGDASGGGLAIYLLYGRLFGYGVAFRDSAGTAHFVDATITSVGGNGIQTFLQAKVCLFHVVFDATTGVLELYVNGTFVEEVIAAPGAITAGGNLTLGATNGGSEENGFDKGLLHGGGYASRVLAVDEIQDHLLASIEESRFSDVPGLGSNWTRAWRVDGGDPGATWSPFVGSGDLTRAGSTPPTYRSSSNPQWR